MTESGWIGYEYVGNDYKGKLKDAVFYHIQRTDYCNRCGEKISDHVVFAEKEFYENEWLEWEVRAIYCEDGHSSPLPVAYKNKEATTEDLIKRIFKLEQMMADLLSKL